MRNLSLSFLGSLAFLVGCVPTLKGLDSSATDVTTAEMSDATIVPDQGMDTIDVPMDHPPVCPLTATGTLAVPGMVTGTIQPTAAAFSPAPSCTNPTVGGDLWRVHIGTATGVTFNVVRTGVDDSMAPSAFPAIAIRSACDSTATELGCAVWAPPSARGRVQVFLQPGDYYVIVAETYERFRGSGTPQMITYSLTASQYAPMANAVCPPTAMLAAGATLSNQHTATGGDVGTLCGQFPGNVVYYHVTVPPLRRISVTATPTSQSSTGTQDQVTLALLHSCALDSCVGAAISSGPMGAVVGAQVFADNQSSTMAADLIIAVGAAQGTTSPDVTFNLTSDASQMIPYTVTAANTGASCDDLSSAPMLTSTSGGPFVDDEFSAPFALATPFQYFGASLGFASISVNGFIQLLPSAASVPAGGIPTSAFPNPNLAPDSIAPYGADLYSAEMADSTADAGFRLLADLRHGVGGTSGSAGYHDTFDWSHVSYYGNSTGMPAGYGGDPTIDMHFQVRLYPMTRVIEFHYCSLTRTPGADGGTLPLPSGENAGIGLQNGSGTNGVSYSFHQVGAVLPGMVVTFTPTS